MGVVEAMELRQRQLTRARARRGGMIRSLALDFFSSSWIRGPPLGFVLYPVKGAVAMVCRAGSISCFHIQRKGNGTEYRACLCFCRVRCLVEIMVSRGEVCCWLTALHDGECAIRPRLQGTVAFPRRVLLEEDTHLQTD